MELRIENDKFIRRAMIISFGVTLLLFILPAIFWVRLREEIPLFYSLPWGQSQVANKASLFILGGTSLIFISINLLLNRFLEKNEIFLRRVLWIGCATAITLALITLIRIILLF